MPICVHLLVQNTNDGDPVACPDKENEVFAVRAYEARMEEELRQARADAYARAHASGDSSTQDRWRKSSGRSQGKSRASEKEKTGGGAGGQKEPPRGSTGATKPKRPPSAPLRDKHLQTLGLKPGQEYSPEEIRKAYRRRAKETHPDAGGNAQEFMAVKAAFEALCRRK